MRKWFLSACCLRAEAAEAEVEGEVEVEVAVEVEGEVSQALRQLQHNLVAVR